MTLQLRPTFSESWYRVKDLRAKLRPDLSSYVYFTTFGKGESSPDISPVAFLVDRCENVYVSGWGGRIAGDFPNAGVSGLTVTPDANETAGGRSYGRIGVGSTGTQFTIPRERVGPVRAIAQGAAETWQWVRLTVKFLGQMFTGEQSARSIGGPILIGQLSGQVARDGAESFLNFMALLSVNLAVLNLLPIPVLDGGHLVFLAIEGIRGRALSLRQRMRLSQVGFVLILMIMAFAIGNDILRLFGL